MRHRPLFPLAARVRGRGIARLAFHCHRGVGSPEVVVLARGGGVRKNTFLFGGGGGRWDGKRAHGCHHLRLGTASGWPITGGTLVRFFLFERRGERRSGGEGGFGFPSGTVEKRRPIPYAFHPLHLRGGGGLALVEGGNPNKKSVAPRHRSRTQRGYKKRAGRLGIAFTGGGGGTMKTGERYDGGTTVFVRRDRVIGIVGKLRISHERATLVLKATDVWVLGRRCLATTQGSSACSSR